MDLAKRESIYALKNTMDSKKPHIYIVAASAGFGKYGENIDLKLEDALGMADVNVRAFNRACPNVFALYGPRRPHTYAVQQRRILPQPGFGIYGQPKLCLKLCQEPAAGA